MITIIESQDKPLNKVIGGEDYQKATRFTFKQVEPKDLKELSELLTRMESEPMKAVIRHRLKEGVEQPARRKGNVEMVPCRWLCLDYDGAAPVDCPDYTLFPEAALEYMIANHWPFLEGVGIHWTLGNSAGVKPQREKLSFHLWVELDAPVLNPKGWLTAHGFDGTLAHTGQIHYTASPDNAPKLAARSGLVEGGPLSGVTETEVREKGKGVSLGHTCPDYLRAELIAEAETVYVTERHPWALGWTLRAITAGMDADEVAQVAMDAVIRMGYSQDRAEREITAMVETAATKLISGEITVDTTVSAELAFPDEEDAVLCEEQADEQHREIHGPSLLDMIREGVDPLKALKEKPITGWGPLKLAELEKALADVGAFGSKAGQISRAALKTMAKKKAQEVTLEVDVKDEFKAKWITTYCQQDAGTYRYFLVGDDSIRLLSKRDELDAVATYLSADMEKQDAVVFRERFYREIHENRQIAEWVTVPKPFGSSRTYLEPRDDGRVNVVVETSFAERLNHLCQRSKDTVVPKAFEDLMDREYGVVFEVMRAALMRRFIGDKRSTVWIHCCSDWGKSFLFDVPELSQAVENDYSAESFKGNDPKELNEKIYFFVDEADRFTKHMKKDRLPYRRLYGGQVELTLPMRILASANTIGDLADHADQQLLNRVIKVEPPETKLKEVLEANGFSTATARDLYVVLLVRRFKAWLEELPASGWKDYAGKEYDAFAENRGIKGVETNEQDIVDQFYHSYIWDRVMLEGGVFRKKTPNDFIWIDNGSTTHPERKRLYIKKPDAWRKHFIDAVYGDRGHSIRKTMSSVKTTIEILGGTACDRLPNGSKFKGFWVPLDRASVDGSPWDEAEQNDVLEAF